MTKINHEEYKILRGLDDDWEWIARDGKGNGGGNLFAYLEKPFKDCDVGEWNYGRGTHPINAQRFQFIQWKDWEPYNIQELIKEYESEETELKRDIEWAIQEIEGLETETSQNYPHDEMIEREIVLGILSQLDEPAGIEETTHLLESVLKENKRLGKLLEEKHEEWLELMDEINNRETLSEEWIGDSVEYAYYMTPRGTYSSAKSVIDPDKLKGILVPKQELPVIPQFVSEWIEGNKQVEEKWNDYSNEDAMNDTIHFTIYGLFADYPSTNSDVELRKPVLRWLSVDRGNYFKLVNSVRYGYEVEEEEQKYYIDLETAAYVAKWDGNGQVDIYTDGISGSDEYELHLTEKEIKDFDPRFWPFRKPVEETKENDED